MKIKHLNIKIYGEVQDVNFRSDARAQARVLNISGFVKNEKDGSVYLEAEGRAEDLEKFLAWCEKGPKYATVSKLETNESPVVYFSSFEVRY
jgi:acylphosphatase